jgi:hypothetical protein
MEQARKDAIVIVALVLESVVFFSIGLVVAVGASVLDLLGGDAPTALALVGAAALAPLAVALLVAARVIGSRGSVGAWRLSGIVRVCLFLSVASSAIVGIIASLSMFADVFLALVAVVGIGATLFLVAAWREARRMTDVTVPAPLE